MKKQENDGLSALRKKAETKLKKRDELIQKLSTGSVRELAHELGTHQIELEMQNEELRRNQAELEASRNRYAELFDFSPIGYITFDKKGLILEVNLTGARLLGVERRFLINKPFSSLVHRDDRDVFVSHCAAALKEKTKQISAIRIIRKDKTVFHTQLESVAGDDGKNTVSIIRTAFSDITERKLMEDTYTFLAQSGWTASGEDFFQALARYLAESLRMDYVCIDRLQGDLLAAETVAVYFDGKFEDNVAYTLKDTPCGDVAGRMICCFPRDVRNLFPRDAVLQDMVAESYVGTTLWSSEGNPIGLIAIIGRKPLADPRAAESIMRLVSVRAADELERRMAEEHTRHLASFPQLNPNPVCEVNSSGQVTFCNPATQKILEDLGFDKENVSIFLPDDLDAILHDLRKKKELSLYREVSVKNKVFGETVYLSPQFDIVRIYAYDITERRRAEKEREQLLAEVQRNAVELDTVFKALPYLVSMHGRDGRYLRVNPAIVKLFGFDPTSAPREEIARRVKARFTDGRPLTPANMPSTRALNGETITNVEYTITDDRGEDHVLLMNAIPLQLEGYIYGAVIAQMDITERKRAEEALTTAHAELAKRAYELEALNRELDAFSYSVSHDLITPLRHIDGFTKAILEDYSEKLDATGRDYLSRVSAATLRMNQHIEAMLNMARLTRRELHERTVNLTSLVQALVDALRIKDPQRQVKFIIAERITAKADQDMLQIVLQNLLDNAWKFTGNHPAVEIEFGVTDMAGRTVYFLRDDGAGFDMQFADKLFMPFKRLHTDSEFPGLGIGLAIAQRIIARHGGRMWAKGEPEKGATFFFTL